MTLAQYKQIETSNIISRTDIEGIITFVNDEFCKIFEYSREELIGKNHNIMRHPDVKDDIFRVLWEIILAKKTYRGTIKNLSKYGKTIYVNTTITPLLDKNGEIVEFIAIRYDVTRKEELTKELQKSERKLEKLNTTLEDRIAKQTKELLILNQNLQKRVEEEVQKNREKDRIVFQQSRLASMGEMLESIAHQWRQPLSELSIALYKIKKIFLTKQETDTDKFMSSYNHSKEVIKGMSKTIEDFRHFFNPNKQSVQFFVRDAVDELLIAVQDMIQGENLEIEVLSPKQTFIDGYLNEFTHVLINLLNNSKDAFINNKIENRNILIEIDTDEKFNATINYSDNAGGINESIIDKVFDPYFTTKHSSVGTGLGLYMSQMIIRDSMHGRISVSNHSDGAKFTIIIPQRRSK